MDRVNAIFVLIYDDRPRQKVGVPELTLTSYPRITRAKVDRQEVYWPCTQ
jgi:hypothetical protein